MKVGDNTYYYITNLQGDIVALVNNAGQTVITYSYSAYCEVTHDGDSTLAVQNPLTYRGYVYDAETGLFYLQSRYYDPEIGRFINADDIAYLGTGELISFNLLTYCENNPVNRVDSKGLFWEELLEALGKSVNESRSLFATAGIISQIDSHPVLQTPLLCASWGQ